MDFGTGRTAPARLRAAGRCRPRATPRTFTRGALLG
jgi:hypothetical protein